MMSTAEKSLVTIVMVTYNSASYVRIAIESILASSYSNFELIISDDCSTDKTWEIIQEYQDGRIRAVRNTHNIGEYPNRNKCISLAKGKYLLFVDGDDVLLPHGLETYVRYAEIFPNAGVVIQKNKCDDVLFPLLLEPLKIFQIMARGRDLLISALGSNFFLLKNLKECRGFKCNLLQADAELRYRFAMRYPILFVPAGLFWHRCRSGQAMDALRNGVGVAELSIIFQTLLKECSNPRLSRYISLRLSLLNGIVTKQIFKFFLKGNFSALKKIFKTKNLKFWEYLRYFFKKNKSVYRKPLPFSPASPLLDLDNFRCFSKQKSKFDG